MKLAVALTLLSSTALSACGASADADNGTVSVDASFYPYAWIVDRVGGDDVTVDNLTQPGVEPHDLTLTAKQIASLQSADLVVFQSDFQSAVDDGVQRAGRDESSTIDVASIVDVRAESTDGLSEGVDDHDHGGEDDHDHGGEDGHAHDESGLDPHVWLDPTNMATIAGAVRDALVEIDPAHASGYQSRAAALTEDLTALDQDFTSGLKTCERDTIVTSHAAFGYLAARYDLKQVPIAGVDPSNEPTGKQLAAISDLVERDGITTVFTEELVSPKVAETVARDTGATTAVLDPIEGSTDGKNYLEIMKSNLAALQKANGCA